jgi:hypothetical protein
LEGSVLALFWLRSGMAGGRSWGEVEFSFSFVRVCVARRPGDLAGTATLGESAEFGPLCVEKMLKTVCRGQSHM